MNQNHRIIQTISPTPNPPAEGHSIHVIPEISRISQEDVPILQHSIFLKYFRNILEVPYPSQKGIFQHYHSYLIRATILQLKYEQVQNMKHISGVQEEIPGDGAQRELQIQRFGITIHT